jgi:5-formyltetrahydrofolate cyclo-ligase
VPGAVQVRKRELREQLRARDSSRPDPAQCVALDHELRSVPGMEAAHTVALYASIQHEPGLDPFAAALRERGATLAFPRTEGSVLVFYEVADLDELVVGYRGILEPAPAAAPMAIARIDAFIVPGLLFDRRGTRLGRGGGHYDRLLNGARSDSLKVGATSADRLVRELPVEDWDVPMDWVVTPVERIRGEAR